MASNSSPDSSLHHPRPPPEKHDAEEEDPKTNPFVINIKAPFLGMHIRRTSSTTIEDSAETGGSAVLTGGLSESISRTGFSEEDYNYGHGSSLYNAVVAGDRGGIEAAIRSKPSLIACKNKQGHLLFHVAARAGQLGSLECLVELLEQTGEDSLEEMPEGGVMAILGEPNFEGNTALHIALDNHQEEMANFLVCKYALASFQLNLRGISPLYLAIKAGFWVLVECIVSLLKDDHVYCPVREQLIRPQHMILTSVPAKSVLHLVIMARKTELLRLLLKHGQILVDRSHVDGRTHLSHAAYIGYYEGVELLLDDEFKDGSIFKRDMDGSFPIHTACCRGHVRIVQLFLREFPNMGNLRNGRGQNILHVATKCGKVCLVDYLLKKLKLTRLINSKDVNGNTPLHLATMGKHPRVVYALTRDKQVHLDAENGHGLTALDVASNYDSPLPTFEERLTRLVLTYAGARQALHPYKGSGNSKSSANSDNYKDRVNTLLLVATLITTITFAAGITLPGGYNSSNGSDNGMANLVEKSAFQAFVISNTVAMYSAILAAVTLIWAQLGDVKLVLFSVKFAVPTLGLSLTMTSVAFMVAVYLVVNDLRWLSILVLVTGAVFLGAILGIFVPLLFPSSIKTRAARYTFYVPLRIMLFINDKLIDQNNGV